MIIELGHFALALALFVTLLQGSLPLVGAHKGNEAWMAISVPAALVQFLLVGFSFSTLTYAFITSDFSVLIVAKNSHTLKPMLYKVSGVWGNHEGSMLMWILILALYGAAISVWGNKLNQTLKVRILGVQALVASGFIIFLLFTSNPFQRVFPPPADGQGLNPLLQDPGLAFHPPLLYLGYVGFSTTFSFAVAALIEGKVEAAWARWIRPWALAAWGFLTAGITLGSWWAYYELGWGGWWFWDPVENASFMPWLAGTALLHSAIVLEKRGTMKSWTIFLAILAFALSLLGTFLVRSGVLTSVHAFATDPSRGIFILLLFFITIGTALILFAWRGPLLKGPVLFQPISREGSLLLNNFLLIVATASIFLGTLYPLFLDVLGLGKISVGAPYFNSVFVPLMIPMILIMGIAPFLHWKRGDVMVAVPKLKIAAAIAFLAAATTYALIDRATVLAAIGLGLAVWLLLSTLSELLCRIQLFKIPFVEAWRRLTQQPRSSWGMTLAHGGLALAIAGMTASSSWKVESIKTMRPGDTVVVSGFEFTLRQVRQVNGPNYLAQRATFDVTRHNDFSLTLEPEKRFFHVSRQQTTEAAIYPTFFGDLYAVIGDPAGQGSYVTRLYFNPLVAWMWAGTLFMVLGAIISLSDRRHWLNGRSHRKSIAPAKV